ncbi:MAG: EFR1 family ferrodoxin [Candidatus Hodarchaeota archaeon]
MKTTIYFFTGTGNSLRVAKLLAESLGDCELVAIAKVWKVEKIESTSENVGFVFPLYYFGLPKIVYDFLHKLITDESSYFFSVITSAEDLNDFPFQQINNILKMKGKELKVGSIINMPNNYIIGYDVTPEVRQSKLFEIMVEKIRLISEVIKSGGKNITEEILEREAERHERINREFREGVNKMDELFYATDSCNNCGICVKVCPVNNIKLKNGIPEWQHNCQLCLACLHFCPETAIQYGKDTLKVGRYHHPEILLKDITNQRE